MVQPTMPTRYMACYAIILSVLRDPDAAQDCFQEFALRYLLNPDFMARASAQRDPDGYVKRAARWFALSWRRRVYRNSQRTAPQDPDQPLPDVTTGERQTILGLADRQTLDKLRANASLILDALEKGAGGALARALRRYHRANGGSDYAVLLSLVTGYEAVAPLPLEGRSENWRRVNLHRLQRRLVTLRPYALGEKSWAQLKIA